MTLQEVIDLVRALNRDFPRTKNAERRMGLYIEIKNRAWYSGWVGQDPAVTLYSKLEENGLETVGKCKDDIPIVIQSFDADTLSDWAERYPQSDLPRVFCFGTYKGNVFEYSRDKLLDFFRVETPEIWRVPDWKEISHLVSGVSASFIHLIKEGSLLDPMVDDCSTFKIEVELNYKSEFVALMHSLDLAVHPYPIKLQDQKRCPFGYKGDNMTLLYVYGGSDAVMTDHVDRQYQLLELGAGSHSNLNFEGHSQREFSLDWYDWNGDALKVCTPERQECKTTQTVFLK